MRKIYGMILDEVAQNSIPVKKESQVDLLNN